MARCGRVWLKTLHTTQNNCWNKNWLGNEQRWAVDSINIVRNGSLWSDVVFQKEAIPHSNIKILQAWSLFRHLNAHKFVQQGRFFLSLLSCNFDDQLSSDFHRFVILPYVGIHQVIILVFNYITKLDSISCVSDQQSVAWVPVLTLVFFKGHVALDGASWSMKSV